MPKMKSCRGAKKRFKVTASGKVKARRAYKGHLLTSKNAKRKRNLRKPTYLNTTDARRARKMIIE